MVSIEIVHSKDNDTHRKLQEKLKSLCARVGWFDNTKYEDSKDTLVSVVAKTQEFGTISKGGHVPPRPFMRPARNQNKNKWKNTFATVSKSNGIEKALKQVSEVAVGDIRKAIMAVWNPPLSEKTVLQRLSRYSKKNKKAQKLIQKIKNNSQIDINTDNQGIFKPLVDTGLLISSLSYEVIKPSEAENEHLTK